MQGLAAGAGLALPVWYYARHIEPFRLEVTRSRIGVAELEGVSPQWKGYTVAFLSDLHLGRHSAAHPTLYQAVNRIKQERPHLVALGGDYFTYGNWNPAMDRLLHPLIEAGVPVIGVMGNHDYMGRRGEYQRIQEAFERLGVKILVNDACPVEYNGQVAWVAGIDDRLKGWPELEEIGHQLPEGVRPLIFLSHNPDIINRLPENYAHLMLSGHTHGGQINPAPPPFNRKLNWIKFVKGGHHSRYPQGWYSRRGTRMYVGRGLGMVRWPLRFNARPELALLELV